MLNRQPTVQEKEFEALPFCPYDPLKISRCENHEFPAPKPKCERCIIETFTGALADGESSTVMRWFIAYRNLEANKQ